MSGDTVTLSLEGEVSLADFATATKGFSDLLSALSAEIAGKNRPEWSVADRCGGSAVITAHADCDDQDLLRRIVSAYETVGTALSANAPVPYSSKVRRAALSIATVLNGHIRAVRFETPNEDITILSPDMLTQSRPLAAARGAIEGRVQVLSGRESLRFSLYDLIFDRAISCYLEPGYEDRMRHAWGHRAIVEGMISRDPLSNRPVSIRSIRDVTVLAEPQPDGYRQARASLPRESNGLPAEQAVRLLRDA